MREILSKTWQAVKSYQYGIFLSICMILISLISYNLGKLNSSGKSSIKESEANVFKAVSSPLTETSQQIVVSTPSPKDFRVVVSKASASKKYHFLWCAGAKQINEENKVYYPSETAAQQAGYTLAGNCKK